MDVFKGSLIPDGNDSIEKEIQILWRNKWNTSRVTVIHSLCGEIVF